MGELVVCRRAVDSHLSVYHITVRVIPLLTRAKIVNMNAPFQCRSCGTHFPPDAVGADSPRVSPDKCAVCGGALTQRTSALDPAPPKRGEGWLWLSAIGDGFAIAALAGTVIFAIVKAI
jgi:hypothetical protein